MNVIRVAALLILMSSCGFSNTFVLRVRDSSEVRAKPNRLFGTIATIKQSESGERLMVFADSQVGAEWSEDSTTITSESPVSANAFALVGWLELDGVGGSCKRVDDPCEPTGGDVVIRTRVSAAPTVVFTLDFK